MRRYDLLVNVMMYWGTKEEPEAPPSPHTHTTHTLYCLHTVIIHIQQWIDYSIENKSFGYEQCWQIRWQCYLKR